MFNRLAVVFCVVVLVIAAMPAVVAASPDEYGRVVIGSRSRSSGLGPAVFDHWLHRAMYTCRLCHVDLGFAMEAGGTGIKSSDNMKGFYCGACHNGKRAYGDKKIFASCSDKPEEKNEGRCEKCHSTGGNVKRDYEFQRFTGKFPKTPQGRGIDWDRAEEEGIIKPLDVLEGVSVIKRPFPVPKDFTIESRSSWMPQIRFSHKKHSTWSGCELCHPEIFAVEKGKTGYTMLDISGGAYCGLCHDRVAFPVADCERCHIKTVR